MPLPLLIARVRIAQSTTTIEVGASTYARAPRFADAASAIRAAVADRQLQFVFDHPGCEVGKYGRQTLLLNTSWVDGEEQLLVTQRDAEEFPLFCIHELVYSGGALEGARCVDVSEDHLDDLAEAVELMRRIAADY